MKRLRAVSLIALAACASHAPAADPKTAATVVTGPADATSAPGEWSYEVDVSEDARAIDVVATFPAGSGDAFAIDDDAMPFAERVETHAASETAWRAAPLRDGAWGVPCANGCAVRYHIRLADAARSLGDADSAMEMRGAVESPPSTWLLRPTTFDLRSTYRFHVVTHGDARFATGVHAIAGAPDTYGANASDIDSAPYTLFGKLRTRTLTRADAAIELAILPGRLALDDAAIDHWIDLSARAIDAYYGHFPVKRLLLVMAPVSFGGETPEGRTLAGGGATILLGVSERMTAADTARDWVLTHEMTHLASPSLPRTQHWLEEGIATYVEPIARSVVGTITAEEMWRGLIDGIPNGQPAEGDRGLDNTHTWGRTYWGGAMFCFVADVEIRKRTQNRASLATALRGVLDGLGNAEIRASIDDVVRAGDRAIGVPVLEELHARMGEKAETIDLAKMWSDLGIRDSKGKITFDDAAPSAAIRRAMTAKN